MSGLSAHCDQPSRKRGPAIRPAPLSHEISFSVSIVIQGEGQPQIRAIPAPAG
jgi:hypothetical protein